MFHGISLLKDTHTQHKQKVSNQESKQTNNTLSGCQAQRKEKYLLPQNNMVIV